MEPFGGQFPDPRAEGSKTLNGGRLRFGHQTAILAGFEEMPLGISNTVFLP